MSVRTAIKNSDMFLYLKSKMNEGIPFPETVNKALERFVRQLEYEIKKQINN